MSKLILKNIGQLATPTGSSAKCGEEMGKLTVIKNCSLEITDGKITAILPIDAQISSDVEVLDCKNNCVLPAFVDCHTHLVFGGTREEEFELRNQGVSYLEILQKGGGILNTVKATRNSSKKRLTENSLYHLKNMLGYGVGTAEVKSGYGLDLNTEIKQLEVVRDLNEKQSITVVPTYMGVHAVPPEYHGRADEYIDFIIQTVLPTICEKKLADFCDVFCEKNVFSAEQSKKLLIAAKKLGMGCKIHADEITSLGGAGIAAEVGAISAEHLLHAKQQDLFDMAKKGVIAVLLPATAYALKEPYADARFMIDSGLAVALATDFNPGSCFCPNIAFVISLAVTNMKMTAAEAITAVTINGAAAIGLADSIGSIEVGKLADLIVLDYPDYRFIPYQMTVSCVNRVIKRGKTVYNKE